MNFLDRAAQRLAALIPTSLYTKEEFLDRVRDKVNYYKPKIEDKCKIDLGTIEVKDYRYALADVDRKQSKDGRLSRKRAQYNVQNLYLENRMLLTACINELEMAYLNSTIYVPFTYTNRLYDLDFSVRISTLDQVVVHELSHALWEKLAYPAKESKDYSKWGEGFASYCDTRFFRDLYPDSYTFVENEGYKEEREMVERLVDEKGKKVILQIPKKWRDFNKMVKRLQK